MAILKTLLESQPEASELAGHHAYQVELDPETRRALARCYLRFARRGRAILAERAAQQVAQAADGALASDTAGHTDNAASAAAKPSGE